MNQKRLSTNKLLEMFAEYNPREHSETDINWTFNSILETGWLTAIAVNSATETIIGGHGRVLAADFGRKQNQEWFNTRYREWLKTEGREPIAEEHKQRFNPSFWEECPCIFTKIDSVTERAANIRLNSTTREGKTNLAKMASIIAELPKSQTDLAGFSTADAKSFVSAYLSTPRPKIDFEPKEYFEKSDATDYENNYENGNFHEDDEMPEVFSSEIALANFDIEELEDGDIRGVNIDKEDGAETRIVLLVTSEELEEYKQKMPAIADFFKISQEGGVKKWRPLVVLEIVRQAYELALKDG